jgi:hypothetical protein
MNKSVEQQPAPAPGEQRVIDLVLADLTKFKAERLADKFAARAEFGADRYGTYLETNNGRDAAVDAYQELLDAAFYLRQAISERGHYWLYSPYRAVIDSLITLDRGLLERQANLRHTSSWEDGE